MNWLSRKNRHNKLLGRNNIVPSASGPTLRLIAALLATFLAAAYASSQMDEPFTNGFEDTDSDGSGDYGKWGDVQEASPGEVVIVGPEGPGDFPVYGEIGVSGVTPNRGDYMLRMGTPKSSNETQPRGINRISQTFKGSDRIDLALWLFSLEHRGDDTLRIHLVDLDDTSGDPERYSATGFDFGNGSGCQENQPCDQMIDVGKNKKKPINSGWQIMSFENLDETHTYTVSIELEAGQNESLASWLYVDSVNQSPTAVIRISPPMPYEGDFVAFDCLESVNPDGDSQTCSWTINGSTELVGSTVAYWARDDGQISVTLTVSDGELEDTATSDVLVNDQDPLVKALDVEVLPGGSVGLVCRYVDPGVDDYYQISFDANGGTLSDFVQIDENDPAMSSGIARATFHAESGAGPTEGYCTVNGVSTGDITILPEGDLADRIANHNSDGISGAPALLSDHSTLGGLTDPNSVAVYQLLDSSGNPFPTGAEVLVTANFPTDYDIAILSKPADASANPQIWASAPFVSVPFVSVPFVSVPFVSVPFVSRPFVSVPFVSVPFVSVPFVSVPFVSVPISEPYLTQSVWDNYNFAFENFPLTQLAGAPDGSNISGLDIGSGDLGDAFSSGPLIDDPVFLKGLSAEFGNNTEQALVKIGPGEEALYLAVIPQAGSFSTAPYSIEVEAYIPPKKAELLGEAICGDPDEPPLTDNDVAGLTAQTLGGYVGSTTLVVTQRERMADTFFNGDTAAFDAWLTSEPMSTFFNDPEVDAKVISVPEQLYAYADSHPCDVQAQNFVVEQIKKRIDLERAAPTGNYRYVQLMGSLDIIPPRYVPDETQTGNEYLFASDLLTRVGTPLGIAVSEGYMLTDAYYVDSVPQPFNGRQLYLEDISVSRMVETPDEIQANAQRFIDTQGRINLYSVAMATGAGTQATGYDFFVDGTEVIYEILSGLPGTHKKLNNSTWSGDDLRCQFFGKACPENESNPAVSALNAVNAHMSYNAALSAKGFSCQYQDDSCQDSALNEAVFSGESAGIYEDSDGDGPAITINGVTFSIGCHSGLSVPDAWGLPKELGLPIDTARDWVQELGTWVGSLNFAYGDTDVADRGTEGIMPLVIANFTGGMSLGDALVRAKQQYAAGLFEFGVYDEKSLVGLNLFGMPQAKLDVTIPQNSTFGSAASFATTAAGDDPNNLVISWTEEDSAPRTAGGPIEQPFNDKGIWYTVNGAAQAIVGRSLLPVVKPFELRPVTGTTVHGVALRGGTFINYLDRDPVFPAQTHDLVQSIGEPQPCVETFSPTLLASVGRFTSGPGDPGEESFIVQPGQFRCNPEKSIGDVIGDFRIWNSLTLELLHPEGNYGGKGATELDSDRKPPTVIQQELVGDPESGNIDITLTARDTGSGMREIIVLIYNSDDQDGGAGSAVSAETSYLATPDVNGEWPTEFTINKTLEGAYGKAVSFQYIDGGGNITAKTQRGILFQAIDVSIKTSIINAGGTTNIQVEIQDFCSLTDPYLIIDYGVDDENGDIIGRYDLADPDCELDPPPASSTFVFPYSYGEITGSVTVKVEARAVGAVGTDEKVLSVCSDPEDDVIGGADIVGCSISSLGTNLVIDLLTREPLIAGVQYRLNLPETNTQIKYDFGADSTNGPNKLKPFASGSGNKVTFELDAARLPWDGVSPIQFQLETQDGVSGGQGQGFVDQTDTKNYSP